MLRSLLEGKPLRHPLHPILIHFPIALFALSLVLDLLSLVLDHAGVYLQGSLYVMTAGEVAALLAAVPGLVDFGSIRRDAKAKRIGAGHAVLNITAVAVYAVNLWFRWGPWDTSNAAGADRVSALGLLLSLVGLGLLVVSGYLGGRMVYGYGVAVGRHRREAPEPGRTIVATSEGTVDGFASVGAAESLDEGGTLRVDLDGTVITVASVDGRFFAVQEFCTHRFGPLSEGAVCDHVIECPWHRSEFDLASGAVVQGPAKVDLPTYEVRVQEGELQVKRA